MEYINGDSTKSPFLFDIISYKNVNLKLIWTTGVTQKQKRRLASICLILATFFNPFGFDILFAALMKWTHSYWHTVAIFYFLSGLFFGLYFFLSSNRKLKEKKE
jgi:hypothetical protein